MKRITIFILSLFILPITVHASELIDVSVENCSSTSSFWVNINGEVKRIGLLAFDTDDTDLDVEILNYICDKFSNAQSIQIEYDDAYTSTDKYNRDLVWVYVDGELLQKDLISKGYGKVNYVYGDYKNLSELCKLEKKALNSKLGIWSFDSSESYCLDNDLIIDNDLNNSLKDDVSIFNNDTLRNLLVFSSLMVLLLMGIKRKGRNEKE